MPTPRETLPFKREILKVNNCTQEQIVYLFAFGYWKRHGYEIYLCFAFRSFASVYYTSRYNRSNFIPSQKSNDQVLTPNKAIISALFSWSHFSAA